VFPMPDANIDGPVDAAASIDRPPPDSPVSIDAPAPDAPPPDAALPDAVPPDSAPPDPVLRSLKFETSGPISVAVDSNGAPVIAGGLINSARFGDITLVAQAMPGNPITAQDLFVVRFGATGQSLWGQRYGDAVDQFGSAVASSGSGTILVAGIFSG